MNAIEWINPGAKTYGMELVGTLPELKGQKFIGKIVKISDEVKFTPKNVRTQKESNATERLKPGMTIEVALPKAVVAQ